LGPGQTSVRAALVSNANIHAILLWI